MHSCVTRSHMHACARVKCMPSHAHAHARVVHGWMRVHAGHVTYRGRCASRTLRYIVLDIALIGPRRCHVAASDGMQGHVVRSLVRILKGCLQHDPLLGILSAVGLRAHGGVQQRDAILTAAPAAAVCAQAAARVCAHEVSRAAAKRWERSAPIDGSVGGIDDPLRSARAHE